MACKIATSATTSETPNACFQSIEKKSSPDGPVPKTPMSVYAKAVIAADSVAFQKTQVNIKIPNL
jgi:hypothetical protein